MLHKLHVFCCPFPRFVVIIISHCIQHGEMGDGEGYVDAGSFCILSCECWEVKKKKEAHVIYGVYI